MKIKKSIFNIILILFIQINGQIILPMTKNLNSYYIKIIYDEDKKKSEFVKVNMALDYSFIPLSDLNNTKIHSEDELIEIDNQEFNTKLISSSNLYLENHLEYTLNNFQFFSVAKDQLDKNFINKGNYKYNNLYYGQFGLGPLYDEINLNILNALKEKKIIDKMIFGISFSNKKLGFNNDILFFGSLEEKNKLEILKNKNIITKFDLNLKLLKKYNKWGFKINAIVLETKNNLSKNIKHKYFAYFNLIEDRIFVPDKIMEYLISRIFNNYIKNRICFINEYGEKKFINCYKNRMKKEKANFPNILFVVNNYSFKLKYEDLFINSIKENEIIFIIQKNYYDIESDIILFGSRFLKKYVVQFDFEEKKIIFNSDEVLPTVNLAQIDDDFWKDMIRDYNKETEHYDSNYDNNNDIDDENEDDESDIYNNEKYSDIDIKNKNENTPPFNDNNNNNKIDNNNNDFDFSWIIKSFAVIIIIIIVFFGLYKFIKMRKKVRLNNEKDYFQQPLNDNEKNEE